jgi:hypothetical protein
MARGADESRFPNSALSISRKQNAVSQGKSRRELTEQAEQNKSEQVISEVLNAP